MDITIQSDHAPITGHLEGIPSGTTIQNATATSVGNATATVNTDNTLTIDGFSAGTATINFDAQDANGNNLPTATLNITITQAVVLATGINIVLDNV